MRVKNKICEVIVMKILRKFSVLVLCVLLAAAFCMGGAAEGTTAKAVRIYGDDATGAPFNQSSWEEFYKPSYFVWFQIDFDIKCTMGTSLLNPQATGDDDLKPAANDLIKLNGRTIKQLNDSLNDQYGAMVAYEPNAEGNLRLAIWLSSARGTVFNTERYKYFTIELMEGLKVPAEGYEPGNGKVTTVEPVKYQISIADLEFKNNPDAVGYSEDKADWLKPMFEEMTAQWEEVEVTPPTEPVVSETPSSTESAESQPDATSGPESSVKPTDSSAPAGQTSSAGTEQGNAPVLAIVMCAIGGVILVVAAVFIVIVMKGQKKPSQGDVSVENGNKKDDGPKEE